MKNQKKIAIVCDWLTSVGGAERVLLAMHELYPDAPIYTSQYDPSKINWFDDAKVKTTWLQSLPKKSTVRKLLPVLRRQAFQHLDLSDYDIIISSSGAEAKAVKKLKKDAVHITYCHAPTHYYWSRYDEYLKEPGFGMLNPVARAGLKILGGPMRKWDYKVAQQPDVLIANSTHIQQKIQEYYDRDSTVIFPPVDLDRFNKYAAVTKRKGMVVAGRQVPYKRFDLAIAAAIKMNIPLTVIGDGPMHAKLVQQAKNHKNITFLLNPTDKEMPKLFSKAEVFLFPGVEDFGITPVEAMAAGTPVVAFGEGGALDYVTDTTGILFYEQTVSSLVEAIEAALLSKWNHKKISKEVKRFNKESFKKQLSSVVKQYL
jgi:glycosyltransferase involved in cell wall biosynthesis